MFSYIVPTLALQKLRYFKWLKWFFRYSVKKILLKSRGKTVLRFIIQNNLSLGPNKRINYKTAIEYDCQHYDLP